MSNIWKVSFRRIAGVLVIFLLPMCVVAIGACGPQKAPEATPGPSPIPTATPSMPTPTAIPTPTLSCAFEPVGEFRGAWSSELGCPKDEEKVIWCAWQEFENGYMLWRIDTGKIYVLSLAGADRGNWQEYDDPWEEGKYPIDIDPDIEPPPGRQQPKRGFGLIWRERLGGPKSDIGWALMEEEGLCAVVQPFERGFMFRYNPEEHSDEVVEKCQVWLSDDLSKFYWPRENIRVAVVLSYPDQSWHSYK